MPTLFDPIMIGTMKVKNRFVYAPMDTHFATPDGYVSRSMIDYYAARAKGGVGLINVEVNFISSEAKIWPAIDGGVLDIGDDSRIPGLRELANAIHANGAKASIQFTHVGKYGPIINPRPVPSAVNPPLYAPNMVLKELTIPEIEKIVDDFAQAARRAKEAGFDAVLIHGAHGLLIQQFLSPYTNVRTDEYGKDRTKFVREVIGAIKKQVGADFPVMIRVSGDEFLSDVGKKGYTIDDMVKIAPVLEDAGVAAIDVSAGTVDTTHWFVQPWYQPKGCILHLAEAIKKAVRIPVIGVGRINDPAFAAKVIEEGRCDMVGLGRGLLADPDFVKKLEEGRPEDIRRCIACCACIDKAFEKVKMKCAINPELGREEEYAIRVLPPKRQRKVVIVGGGPAGLEAARVAKMRGNRVVLFEKGERLGGQLLMACVPPSKEEIKNLIEYYEVQMKKLNIDVRLNCEATPEIVLQENPEVVVIATGASPIIPKIPGVDGKNVVTAFAVLSNKAQTGERVVVLGGNLVGCETAEFLAERGKKVTVVEMLNAVGLDFSPLYQPYIRARMVQNGITLLTKTKGVEVRPNGLIVENEKGEQSLIEADTVVLAVGAKSENSLYAALCGKVPEIHMAGDCEKPAKIMQAVHEGARIGRVI